MKIKIPDETTPEQLANKIKELKKYQELLEREAKRRNMEIINWDTK